MHPSVKHADGVYYDMPDPVYRQAEGANISALKAMHQSPAHYLEHVTHPPPATPALVWGKVLHHLLLTPKAAPFWKIAPPDINFRTKAGKEWKEAHSDLDIITAEEWQHIQGAAESVRKHPIAASALQGRYEVSVFQQFSYGGTIQRKCRIDVVNDGRALVDIKTTEDASFEEWPRQAYHFRYHAQGAYYLDIWNDANPPTSRKETFAFVAVEKTPPYSVNVYVLSEDMLKEGRRLWHEWLGRLIDSKRDNRWPCYDERVWSLELPRYVKERQRQVIV